MKRKTAAAVVTACLTIAGMGGFAAIPAAATITHPNNNGHPSTNPAGNCPPGQNKGATPGALNKC